MDKVCACVCVCVCIFRGNERRERKRSIAEEDVIDKAYPSLGFLPLCSNNEALQGCR